MTSARAALTKALRSIPGVQEVSSAEYPDFVSFEFNGKAFAHFDTNTEFDLKLGKARIENEGLAHPRDSTKHPNRHRSKPNWIVLPLGAESDVDEALRLVSLLTGE